MAAMSPPANRAKTALQKIDMVLPAGGRIDGEFAQMAGAEIKALIQLDGQTILRRALETLQAVECVGRVVVIGPEEARAEGRDGGASATLAEGDSGPENIFRGLEWLHRQNGAASRVLIAATDLPFLTPEAVNAFLKACPPEADVAAPVITQEAFEARFPGSINTFVPLREGAFTLGSVFLVNPEVALRSRPHLERVSAARKSQLALARLLGLPFLLRFLTRRLTVAHIERRCQQILGCVGAAIPDSPPELAFDIDLPEEYAYVQSLVGNGKGAPR